MPSVCYDIQKQLPKYRRGEIRDAAFIEEHLKTCVSCAAELERLGGKLNIVLPAEEETNRAIRFVEAVKKHLWLQILLVVSAVVAFCAYCFIFGNALLGSYVYLYDLRLTVFLILELIVCVTAILVLVTVLLRISGLGARSKRRAVRALASNRMLVLCVAILVCTASLVGYGKISDYIFRNRFAPGVWTESSRVFTNEWANFRVTVPEGFEFANDQYFIDHAGMTKQQYEKQFSEAHIDLWIYTSDPECFIDLEIVYINRRTYRVFSDIKDDEQLRKTAARLQYLEKKGTTPVLDESEIIIAGENYYSASMYDSDTDLFYNAYARLHDKSVIIISLGYSGDCEDEAMALLQSFESLEDSK